MEVESRKETRESKRKEEEIRRTERKRKFSTNMGWDTQRGRISPVDVSGTDILTCLLDNTLGVGANQIPGVTVEGMGVVVPGAENAIYEQPQATDKVMTQQLDGTSGSMTGPELGPIAEVGEGQGYYDERESGFCQAL